MLAKWKDGRVTICSANGFVCLQASEVEALSKLEAHGLSLDCAHEVLRNEVPAAEWRATFVQAAAATAVALEESVRRAAEASDVEDVRNRQSELANAVDELRKAVAADRRKDERRELEIYLAKRAEQMIAVSVAHGVERDSLLENKVWEVLFRSAEGQRLLETRDED